MVSENKSTSEKKSTSINTRINFSVINLAESSESSESSKSSESRKREAAEILFEASKSISPTTWSTIESAEKEVADCCQKDYIAIGLVRVAFPPEPNGLLQSEILAGWVGLRPMYDGVTWELHPLMVKPALQGQGIGTRLLTEIERIAADRHIQNIVLGTDDELGKTSLSKLDLFQADLCDEIKRIRNLDRHPYEFYQKNGYKIIGVVPDAGGRNQPDILMAKRLQ
ncbi:MAG: GNAT family N-acetyltransferase [Spirochaetia bacterium]|nr:GNAT family N-acetyltransferase [Spirochaetia bacterium]